LTLAAADATEPITMYVGLSLIGKGKTQTTLSGGVLFKEGQGLNHISFEKMTIKGKNGA